MTHLSITQLTVHYPGTAVPALTNADLHAASGELIAVLGPSGSGKSSLLRAVAGLVPLHGGNILVNGTSILALPPERRGTALMFQQPALFPHLSVLDNVAFGPQMQGVNKKERQARAQQMLHAVQLAGYEQRRPHQLSGGQQQRVALARALATQPRVLLLDEPFAALDPGLRDEMRMMVARLQREHQVTTLLVTHDQSEAALLADRVALVIDGRVQQVAAPENVFARPDNSTVARFVGVHNLVPGTLQANQHSVCSALGTLQTTPTDLLPGPVLICFRPEYLRLSHAEGGVPALVVERQFLATLFRYHVAVADLLLTVLATDGSFAPGAAVNVVLPEPVWVVPC